MGKLNWERITCVAFILFSATSIGLRAQNATLTTLYSFCSLSNCADGGNPQAELVQGTDGNFYGTTPSWGDSFSSNGTVFKITPSGELTTLYTFCSQGDCTDGDNPTAGLVQGSDGDFYGTTAFGGTYGNGTVFKISPSGTLTTLNSFCAEAGCPASPWARLVQASDGNFYGTTGGGGANDGGTVFKITPSGTLTTLYSFCSQNDCADGENPNTGLVQGTDGNFYGTTPEVEGESGVVSYGTVYQITPSGTLTTLYTFCSQSGCTDGYWPSGALVQGHNGNFYGETEYGGAEGEGTVFEITASGTLTTLHSFCSQSGCSDGYWPFDYSGLVQGSDGNFYGTTGGGAAGIGEGTVFQITPSGTLATLYTFCSQSDCTDGEYPRGGLVQGTGWNFYGTTAAGGTYGYGTVFSFSVQDPTTTTLTSSVNPSVFGEPFVLTATVTPQTLGTPTGTVTFYDGTTSLCGTADLPASGTVQCDVASIAVGTHSITAVYSGDSNFLGSTSSALLQNVNKASTNTGLTSSANPSAYGQSVIFTATVSVVAPGGGTPTGTVTFDDGTTAICNSVPLSLSGQAQCVISSLAVGSHSITAVYSGDANFQGSTSSPLTQTVNKTSTSTAVASSLNPSQPGQSVTFTATVTVVAPGSGTPTGTVTFNDGAAGICLAVALSSGQAQCTTSSLAAGRHSITAVYSGDSNFLGSTSSPLTQTVGKASTSTGLVSSPNPSLVGQSVTFTATVTTQASGTPTGTVNFSDGTTVICTSVALSSSSQAQCTVSTLAVGTHSITAAYSGDSNFQGSPSSPLTQTVNRASTATAVASSLNPSGSGQSVTFTATVTVVAPGSGTPTGTVTFNDGTTVICNSVALSSSGQAPCTVSTLAARTHSITAVYSGDSNFQGSTSSPFSQTVGKASTSTAVTSSLNPSGSGQSVTFTATVTVVASASGTPTGTVTINDGTTAICNSVALSSSGQAPCTVSTLAAGTHSITAVYSGDANFQGSTSSPLTQTVSNKASTSTAVASSLNPSVVGQSVSFTATVTTQASGTPTGSVTFNDGTTAICSSVALSSSGQAPCTVSTLAVGTHSITAVYSGDPNFQGSSSSPLTQTVNNKASTSTAVASSLNPSGSGQSVTFTAKVTVVAPGSGTPTGTVTFNDGTTVICNSVALSSSGQAPCSVSTLAVGTHSITAVYSGDANFQGSTSSPLTQTVNPPPTAPGVTLTAPAPTSTPGQYNSSVALSSPATGDMTGTLSLKFSVDSKVANVTSANYSDPAMGFMGGSGQQSCTNATASVPHPNPCSTTFTIAAGSSTTPPVSFQVGAVAGKFTLTLTSLSAGGTTLQLPDPLPSTSGTISASAPSITPGSNSVTIINVTSTAFEVVVSPASTSTRELVSATFSFQAANGTQLTGGSPAPVAVDATSYFSSQTVGGSFGLTETFAFSGDTSALGCVTVMLTNSVGTSSPVNGCVQ